LKGQPLIVDTGISTYEKNARRRRERSTAAHNTVSICAKNSSDVWGGFRVGKRARTQVLSKDDHKLVAKHNGYGYPHQRRFELTEANLYLKDNIGPKQGTARFHLHEDHTVTLTEAALLGEGFRIRWSTGKASVRTYERSLGFNFCIQASVLEISFAEHLEVWVEWE
ncbi:MAG: heparinase II/III-family protein, partial [Bacteroidota bacterium]